MTSPWLTIIIPTFNAGQNIAKCLDSILVQTEQDTAVYVLDGLSTDNTVAIANRFSPTLKNLIVLSQKDAGIYDAMNNGIHLAQTSWLYFLGSDDALANENVLQNVKAALKADPQIDVLYGKVASARAIKSSEEKPTINNIVRHNICHQAIFIKQEVFEKTGLFNLSYSRLADWDHNMKWFLHPGISHAYLDLVIAEYADGGVSSVQTDRCFLEDRRLNYLQYGVGTLPFMRKLQVFSLELLWATLNFQGSRLRRLLTYTQFIFHKN